MNTRQASLLQRSIGLFVPATLFVILLFSFPALIKASTYVGQLLVTPYPNDGIEGTLLHEARLIAAGEALYRPLSRHEFVSAPYPPLYFAALALFDTLQGPSIFWGGRLVSTICALGVCLSIVLIVYCVGRSWLAGLIGAALFFMAPAVTLWATRIKPDMLALGLATLGLLAVIKSQPSGTDGQLGDPQEPVKRMPWRDLFRPGSMGWLVVAAVLFTLAFFTRQTTGAAAVASTLGLLLNDILAYRRGKNANFLSLGSYTLPIRLNTIRFGFLLATLCLGGWWLADLITAHQYSAHLLGLHRSEWWSFYLVKKYTQQLYPYWPVLLLLTVFLKMKNSPRVRILYCYIFFAPITLIGAAEISAHHNHLLETLLVCSLALGMALAWAASQARQSANMPGVALVLGLACVQIFLASQEHPFFRGELAPPDPPMRFVHFVANTPGEILADDVGLLLAGGKSVRYDDPSTMGPAARWGIWDQRGLLEEIEAKKFSAILLRDDVHEAPYDDVGRWTREMRQAIQIHYQMKFRDKIRVYVPKE